MKLVDKWLGAFLLLISGWGRSKKPLPQRVRKILVIKLIAMGDLLVITPLVRTLKQAYPDAAIDLLCAPRVKPIAANMSLYHEVHYLSFGGDFLGSFWGLVRRLRAKQYDLVLDLEFYYYLMTWFSLLIRPAFIMGFDLQPIRSKVVDLAVPFDENVHVVDAFLAFATSLGVTVLDGGLEPLAVSEAEDRFARKWISDDKVILIHVGTSQRAMSRRWSCEKWENLITLLSRDYQVILVGGSEELSLLENMTLPSENVLNMAGELTMTQLAALMKRAWLYIGLDTGPTHLAAAMGMRIVALYGPNTPVRWGPYAKNATVIYHALGCSPCTRQFEGVVSTCQDNLCMQVISVEDVFAAVNAITD